MSSGFAVKPRLRISYGLSLNDFSILSTSSSRWNADASRDNNCSRSASTGVDEDTVGVDVEPLDCGGGDAGLGFDSDRADVDIVEWMVRPLASK